MNRQGVEFSFAWLFAIIAGTIILVSAIYFATKLIHTEQRTSDTLVASELDSIIGPLETNLESSKYSKITLLQNTRVYNDCSLTGPFGKQQLSTASQTSIGTNWGIKSVSKSSFNKYIFSSSIVTGKKLNVITKPFLMPYKIGDLTILYSGLYCFVNPPTDIENEITDLSGGNSTKIDITFTSDFENCPKQSKTVCFNQLGCDVSVNTGSSTIVTGSETIYFTEPLLYSAIFSDPKIYECQLKRLMKRGSELGQVYSRKSSVLEGEGCTNNLAGQLQTFATSALINDSRQFVQQIVPLADNLGRANEQLSRCHVF